MRHWKSRAAPKDKEAIRKVKKLVSWAPEVIQHDLEGHYNAVTESNSTSTASPLIATTEDCGKRSSGIILRVPKLRLAVDTSSITQVVAGDMTRDQSPDASKLASDCASPPQTLFVGPTAPTVNHVHIEQELATPSSVMDIGESTVAPSVAHEPPSDASSPTIVAACDPLSNTTAISGWDSDLTDLSDSFDDEGESEIDPSDSESSDHNSVRVHFIFAS